MTEHTHIPRYPYAAHQTDLDANPHTDPCDEHQTDHKTDPYADHQADPALASTYSATSWWKRRFFRDNQAQLMICMYI